MGRRRKSAGTDPPPGPPASAKGDTADVRERLSVLQPRNEEGDPVSATVDYITFRIAGEMCAVPLARALEIARCERITAVPSTPPCLRGVTNIRGSVVPVVDLAPSIIGEATTIGDRTSLLLIEVDWAGERIVMALLVDSMGRVLNVAGGEIRPAPSFGMRVRREWLLGLIPSGERFILILDADRALASEELLARHDGPGPRGPVASSPSG